MLKYNKGRDVLFMKDKIIEFFEKSVSGEAVLKRIAVYLLVACILLGLIFFKLSEINQTILDVSNPILSNIKTEENESVKDVFIEDNDNVLGEVLPLYDELKEDESKNTTENKSEIPSDKTTTEKNIESTVYQQDNSKKYDFVINVNSKKIHYADCTFVSRMKEENRKVIQLSNDELNEYINNGYTLCSTCGG